MALDVAESHCWHSAYELLANGETEKAIAFCESEPCTENLECQRFLGWTYYKKDDFDTALNWFEKGVKQGDADAAFGVGSVHFLRRDFPSAIQYFERAVDSGYGRACHWLGYIHRHGLGVPPSDSAASAWFKRGADQGYLVAERALIDLAWRKGGIVARIRIAPRLLHIKIKAAAIALQDINDKRLADIPKTFERQPRVWS